MASALLLCLHFFRQSCAMRHPLLRYTVKQRDHTADAYHGYDCPHANAGQPAGKCHADHDRDRDVAQVKAVFCKAYAFADRIRDGLHNTVARVGYQPHIERSCCAHAG